MSILSDAEIRNLCVPPTEVFDQEGYVERIQTQNLRGWPLDGHAVQAMRTKMREESKRPPTAEELAAFKPMISPFSPESIREAGWDEILAPDGVTVASPSTRRRIISRGLTSYGYDVSLSAEGVQLFTNLNTTIIDPKRLDPKCIVDARVHTDEDGSLYSILPPNSYMLAHTIEYFHIPRDVLVICLGKSTYARAGIGINVTPIEPEWHGNVVIEICNSTNLPAKIYLEEGISQFVFLRGNKPCEVSYADRNGKYLGQTGTTHSKV